MHEGEITPDMTVMMNEWLEKRGIEHDAEGSKGLCLDKLGLDGDNLDACLNYVYAFERGTINNDEFLAALCEVTGKEPQEVIDLIKQESGEDAEEETEAIEGIESPGDIGETEIGDVRPEERDTTGNVESSEHQVRADSE